MKYSELTNRLESEGSAAWDLHFEAMERRRRGEDVIVLSIGDPDFDSPAPAIRAAIGALEAGKTHYAAVAGIEPLRRAIATRHQARSGQAVTAANVIVAAGGQCALYSAAQCLLNPGDEVLVVDPAYVTYEGVFAACGAHMVRVPALPENGFVVRAEDIRAAVGPRCRALLVNSPHNPTGAIIDGAGWQRIAEICIENDLWLISDEVYADLIFEGRHVSPASLPGMTERTATINSLSKSHAMTGWRLGWVVGPQALAQHIERLFLSMLYGSPEFIQIAACKALEEGDADTAAMRLAYQARRDAVCAALAGSAGLRALCPPAGMFVMLDVRDSGRSAQQFGAELLERQGVALLPGDAFGAGCRGHLRLGLVEDVAVLQEACRRIRAYLQQIQEEGVIHG